MQCGDNIDDRDRARRGRGIEGSMTLSITQKFVKGPTREREKERGDSLMRSRFSTDEISIEGHKLRPFLPRVCVPFRASLLSRWPASLARPNDVIIHSSWTVAVRDSIVLGLIVARIKATAVFCGFPKIYAFGLLVLVGFRQGGDREARESERNGDRQIYNREIARSYSCDEERDVGRWKRKQEEDRRSSLRATW